MHMEIIKGKLVSKSVFEKNIMHHDTYASHT